MPKLAVEGIEMDYAEAGAGAPLVLLHGSLQDQRYWSPQMAAFGGRFRTIAVSLRHYWPERWDGQGHDFTIAQHVDDVAGFLRALDAGPVRLVGHSRGGHIAFRVAERFPELLHSVVLAEPGGELDETLGGRPGGAGLQAANFARAATLIRAGDLEGGLRVIADQTGGEGAWARLAETRKQIARDNAMTMLGQVNEQRAPFSREAALAIRTPVLLVGGANTQPSFTVLLEALHRTIPGAGRVTIPRGGHSMSAENPAAFNAAVLAFLTGGDEVGPDPNSRAGPVEV